VPGWGVARFSGKRFWPFREFGLIGFELGLFFLEPEAVSLLYDFV
jgi:hypothetical protein